MTVAESNTEGSTVRQRSLNLDDYTYGLLVKHAEAQGLTNSSALRVLLRQTLGEQEFARLTADSPTGRVGPLPGPERQKRPPTAGAKGIVLPPEGQENFKGKGKGLQAAGEEEFDLDD